MVVTAISAATMISSPNQMEVWEHGSCQAVTGTWERAWATWQALNSWQVRVQTRSRETSHLQTRSPGPVTTGSGILLFKVFYF